MIEFHLVPGSGVSVYLQLVQQVRDAVRFGRLAPGDQLPTAREVVGQLAINPNTVLKAYGELERDGLVRSRAGQGTFVLESGLRPLAPEVGERLRQRLREWLDETAAAGLDQQAVLAMVSGELAHSSRQEEMA